MNVVRFCFGYNLYKKYLNYFFFFVYMLLRFREIKIGYVDLINIFVIEEWMWFLLGEVLNGYLVWFRDL